MSLWRVRGTLPDQPGTLAALANAFGAAGVNILALQVFPGLDEVTDEIVVRAPDGADIEGIMATAGATDVVIQACTEAALTDQPTLYVEAARTILQRPTSFPEVVARLFDAEPDPVDGKIQEFAEFTVGDVQVSVHRTAPFTDTEQARGEAIAGLVSDVMARTKATAAMLGGSGGRRIGGGMTPEYVVEESGVAAVVDDTIVGQAQILAATTNEDGDVVRAVDLHVDPAWQRRGIGTRLLTDSSRLAHGLGADEILLTTRADNQAVLPMVLAAGLRGRIRMAGDDLTVRVPVRDLKPLDR
ncbi:GNAT family N-acetyltransferase [Nocardioides sp. Kera G14]|uniref:GNAT family N-acetyltransferase n=1 Tax=Nocardioides sp. Kera G14 TaxID=2884264 RepID=UPI001D0FC2B1|nr:GNAT family N-acetyltransferase [Nocardioides sp. Kera G14]UDY24327.1 GNAT family N-acetyltransferase [Nocardioides sp. Kera G14]